MPTTITAPTGNARNHIRANMTADTNTLTLMGLLTHGSVSVQLAGTWTGTVAFQTTTDGTNWVTVGLFPSATPNASVATSATANGAWGDLIKGYGGYRLACSAAMTGTVNASIRFLQGQY